MTFYLYMWLCVQDARLTLKADAAVDVEYLALSDLVVDEGLPGDLREKLSTVYLGRAPERGERRLVTADDVRRELAWRGYDRVAIDGPAVLVTREDASVVSAHEAAVSFATQAIRRLAVLSMPERAAGDVVVHVTYLDARRVPANVEFVRVAARTAVVAGNSSYWLEVKDPATGRTDVVSVVAKIGLLQAVAYARRDLGCRQKISREDFDVRREETDGTQGWVTQIEALVGGQALERIRAGEPIKAACVKLRPVVRRGAVVAACAPNVTIEARVLEDGAAGDVVACEFTGTKAQFQGRVVSGQVVDIVGRD